MSLPLDHITRARRATVLLAFVREHGFRATCDESTGAVTFDVPWIHAVTGEIGHDTHIVYTVSQAREALGY